MIKKLDDPFYYLANFQHVLAWIGDRYQDLLSEDERAFIGCFPALPQPSKALLVRMIMRKGSLFRTSKLAYDEIGDIQAAVAPLVGKGWLDPDPPITLTQLFGLLNKSEIASAFCLPADMATLKKPQQLDALRDGFAEPRPFSSWHPGVNDVVYEVRIMTMCDRLRLMYFGNLHQDWSTFILSDLGIHQFEKVALTASSRAFHTCREIDDYCHLHQCRQRFEEGAAAADILSQVPQTAYDNPWLEARRAKLLFALARHYEKNTELPAAFDLYRASSFPGSRLRTVRVLEKTQQFAAAFALAQAARDMPENEAERQQLLRIMPRLRRKLGLPKLAEPAALPMNAVNLKLVRPHTPCRVEVLVRDYLTQPHAPVLYVENCLINSLFGLLCWNAVFAAVPGAFFHPFQRAPADLNSPDFVRRRQQQFAACLAQLESGQYQATIRQTCADKAGIQSPFVTWEILSDDLLEIALACLPASHLKKWFERMLQDIASNCAGYPDLIQFWPQEKRYRMIEVKGPGDRLQDNQIRWLEYCAANDMPVQVCYVEWQQDAG